MNSSNRKGAKSASILMGCQFAVAAALLVGLSGCATPADPKAMIAAPQAATTPFPQPLVHAMCVRSVTGGEKTNPLWASKVDDEAFKSALTTSLDSAGLIASSGCQFPIDANLLGLSQPSFGFDMTVTSHVNYKAYNPSGEPLVLETVDTPFTATVSDAFVGVKRLQIANEGAIRKSIETFIDKLHSSSPKVAAPAAPAKDPAGK